MATLKLTECSSYLNNVWITLPIQTSLDPLRVSPPH